MRTESDANRVVEGRTPQELYLGLLKRCLTRTLFPESLRPLSPREGTVKRLFYLPVRWLLSLADLELARPFRPDPAARSEGRDWPPEAETMIGLRRLNNLEKCISDVLTRGVPGDLVEVGVWRGGAAIFMKAVLESQGDQTRLVWAADSFMGLPKPDGARYPADAADEYQLWSWPQLAASLEEVKRNFDRYGLLDDRIRFLPGWFRDTLPIAPIERISVLRLDGDLYESTILSLESLYKKLSVGGYVIVDDYGAIDGCKAAVEDFRAKNDISESIRWIDWAAVFWQKAKKT